MKGSDIKRRRFNWLKRKNQQTDKYLTTNSAITIIALTILVSAFMLPYAVTGANFWLRLSTAIAGTTFFAVVGWMLATVALKLSKTFFSLLFGGIVMTCGLTFYSLALFPSFEFTQRLSIAILAGLLLTECLLILGKIVDRLNTVKRGITASKGFFAASVVLSLLLLYTISNRDDKAAFHYADHPLFFRHFSKPDPSRLGTFAVKTFTYGSGRDTHRTEYGEDAKYITCSVDGSPFLQGWTSNRTRYWGFDPTQLPINGRVWLPAGPGPFPLVIIVHGVHEMIIPSDAGFAYLGNLLASRGYIVASLDENFLNWGWQGRGGFLDWDIDARAWLILQHLKQWQAWNNEKQSPLYRKVDMQNIALIGHSLGGEAITLAAAYNRMSRFQGNAEIKFDFHFNIKSLIALSPSDYYQPANERIPVQNVNYLVLHGSQDNDLSSFLGTRVYTRVQFTEMPVTAHPGKNKREYFLKTLLYIGRANHSQFNTTWGIYDKPWPSQLIENTKILLSGEDQRQIAKVYIAAFLDATLKGERGYLPLFEDYRLASPWLPATSYVNKFSDSTFHIVCNFDEDTDPETTTIDGGRIRGSDLVVWREQDIGQRFAPINGLRENNAVYLAWDTREASPTYEINLRSAQISSWDLKQQSKFAFSLAYPAGSSALDFSITLVDKKGMRASVLLSRLYSVTPAWSSRLTWLTFFERPSSQIVFQTVFVPISEFMKNNNRFEPNKIQKIIFGFDRKVAGGLLLDDIGFFSRSLN